MLRKILVRPFSGNVICTALSTLPSFSNRLCTLPTIGHVVKLDFWQLLFTTGADGGACNVDEDQLARVTLNHLIGFFESDNSFVSLNLLRRLENVTDFACHNGTVMELSGYAFYDAEPRGGSLVMENLLDYLFRTRKSFASFLRELGWENLDEVFLLTEAGEIIEFATEVIEANTRDDDKREAVSIIYLLFAAIVAAVFVLLLAVLVCRRMGCCGGGSLTRERDLEEAEAYGEPARKSVSTDSGESSSEENGQKQQHPPRPVVTEEPKARANNLLQSTVTVVTQDMSSVSLSHVLGSSSIDWSLFDESGDGKSYNSLKEQTVPLKYADKSGGLSIHSGATSPVSNISRRLSVSALTRGLLQIPTEDMLVDHRLRTLSPMSDSRVIIKKSSISRHPRYRTPKKEKSGASPFVPEFSPGASRAHRAPEYATSNTSKSQSSPKSPRKSPRIASPKRSRIASPASSRGPSRTQSRPSSPRSERMTRRVPSTRSAKRPISPSSARVPSTRSEKRPISPSSARVPSTRSEKRPISPSSARVPSTRSEKRPISPSSAKAPAARSQSSPSKPKKKPQETTVDVAQAKSGFSMYVDSNAETKNSIMSSYLPSCIMSYGSALSINSQPSMSSRSADTECEVSLIGMEQVESRDHSDVEQQESKNPKDDIVEAKSVSKPEAKASAKPEAKASAKPETKSRTPTSLIRYSFSQKDVLVRQDIDPVFSADNDDSVSAEDYEVAPVKRVLSHQSMTNRISPQDSDTNDNQGSVDPVFSVSQPGSSMGSFEDEEENSLL
jgi:hypothetical protein